MKGIQGLIVAVGLGILGAILNFAYLHNEAQKLDLVYFIAVKPDATIARGDKLVADKLVKLGVPKQSVGNLKDFAILYEDLRTVEGAPVWRTLSEGSLLLQADLVTPTKELDLGKGEKAMWIPVDTKSFEPSLVVPGDMVSFLISLPRANSPTRAVPGAPGGGAATAAPSADASAEPAAPPAQSRMIGPFKVLALGNRLGSTDVMKAAKISQVHENLMTISVTLKQNGELQDDAQALWDMLGATNFRGAGVILHDRKSNNK